jgi:NhaP-type Na+/H+ or K+/H+ antiporter
MLKFNKDVFFDFLLPPIVFAAGFNMSSRRKFFENFANISLFGVIGTFVAFTVYCSITLLATSSLDMK